MKTEYNELSITEKREIIEFMDYLGIYPEPQKEKESEKICDQKKK